jgi:hypothetical protein
MKYLATLANLTNSQNNHIHFTPLDTYRLNDPQGKVLATILKSDVEVGETKPHAGILYMYWLYLCHQHTQDVIPIIQTDWQATLKFMQWFIQAFRGPKNAYNPEREINQMLQFHTHCQVSIVDGEVDEDELNIPNNPKAAQPLNPHRPNQQPSKELGQVIQALLNEEDQADANDEPTPVLTQHKFSQVLTACFWTCLLGATSDRVIWIEIEPKQHPSTRIQNRNRPPQPPAPQDLVPNPVYETLVIAAYYNHGSKTLRLFNTKEGELTILNTNQIHLEKRLAKQPESQAMTKLLKSQKVKDAADHIQMDVLSDLLSAELAKAIYGILPTPALGEKKIHAWEFTCFEPEQNSNDPNSDSDMETSPPHNASSTTSASPHKSADTNDRKRKHSSNTNNNSPTSSEQSSKK